MTAALLPPNASAFERAAAEALGAGLSPALPIRDLWSPERCPAPLLPWLAWALSVDAWDAGWPEETQRRVIAESLGIHRVKGSRAAVERALAALGYGDATVVEGAGGVLHDGTAIHDGAEIHGADAHWAEYRVFMLRPITGAQAAVVRRALERVQPVRCRLLGIVYQGAIIHDGSVIHDATHTHGGA